MELRILFIVFTASSVCGQAPDLTNIIQQYVDACSPNSLCPISRSVHSPVRSMPNIPSACPPCDCDSKCISRGTCCPDILVSSKTIQKCVDVTVTGEEYKDYRYMVPSCSEEDYCKDEPFDVKIRNTPVSSLDTFYSYQTKKLAERYENPKSLIHWGTEFICNNSVDFNFISEFSKLLETVRREGCTVKYTPSNLIKAPACSPLTNTVSRCNITGLWGKYDPGIDWSCSNLHQHSGLFDNIFCRLCNPSRTSQIGGDSLITVCNQTGLWSSFDKEVEDACMSGSKSDVTYPFKNIFCRICNINFDSSVLFKEVKGIISETVGEHGYLYHIHMTGFSEEELSKLKRMAEVDAVSISYSNMILRDGGWKNKSNLVTQYQAVTGSSTCETRIASSCVCDPSCFEDLSKECCIDFRLQYSMDSPKFKYSYDNSSQGLVAISSCNVKNAFTEKCLNPTDDFLGSFPVTDLSMRLHYANVYCYLCNQRNASEFANISRVVPWNITINSSEILDIQYHTSIMDIVKSVFWSKQEIILSPHLSSWPKRQHNGLEERTCNNTGVWQTYDLDIVWACHSINLPFEIYYNAFCKICNPSINWHSRFDKCNVTRKWDMQNDKIKSACTSFPEISASFPFKNQFCKFCNSPSSTYVITTTQSPKEFGGKPASLRDIFNVFKGHEEKKCSPLYVRDSEDTCRKMRCFPGKILTKDGCMPLLPVTKNLNYTIYFSISIPENVSYDTNDVKESIRDTIKAVLNVSEVTFRQRIKNITIDGNKIIDIENNFFVNSMLRRAEAERNLVAFGKNPMEHLKNLQFLKPNISRFLYESDYLTQPNAVSQETGPYRNVIVASIITCKQIELNEYEIEVLDSSRKKIRIIHSQTELEQSDYYITEHGAYAVCLDVFCGESLCNSSKALSESDLQNALRIFTIVCTVPSLLCLMLTFTHYCLFKKLRTTNGIHVMSLIVSLFFSQFFFQFFLRKDFQGDSGCRVVGMIIHYWWMATFCCYALNGYLMFMTFRASIAFHSDDKRVYKRYFLFSYGIPLAVVLLTLFSNLFASGDAGYGADAICFLNNAASLIVSFVLIIGTVCLLNIAFFSFVMYKILLHRRQQQNLGINTADRDMILVFFKLFFISGLSWVLFLVDAFIPEVTFFSFVVTFVNCLQGVLLFCLEVCSKKSREMYKDFKNSRRQGRPRKLYSSSKRSVLRAAREASSRSGSQEYINNSFTSIDDVSITAST